MADYLSKLDENVKTWWLSFCNQAKEKGYDFENSPTDLMLVQKSCWHQIKHMKGYRNMEVMQGVFLKDNYTAMDEYAIHSLEEYPKMYERPNEKNITAMYEAAKENKVVMWKKNAKGGEERNNGDDFYCIVGVNKDGTAHISRSLGEIGSDHSDELYEEEFKNTIGGVKNGRDYMSGYMTLTEMTMNNVNVVQTIDDEELSSIIYKDEPGDDERTMYYFTRLGLYSNNVKDKFEVRTLDPLKGVYQSVHNYVALEIENDIMRWTGASDKDLRENRTNEMPLVYDSKMMPVDFDDKAKLMNQIMDGLYIYKLGETRPHSLRVLPQSGLIKYSVAPEVRSKEEPAVVEEPNSIIRFFHNVSKLFGGNGFESCRKYDAYIINKQAREAINAKANIIEQKLENEEKQAQLKNAQRKETESAYTKAREMAEKMKKIAKQEENSETKELFTNAAQRYENFANGKLTEKTAKASNDVTLATLITTHLIMRERETNSSTQSGPGPIEKMVQEKTAKEFVREMHKTEAMQELLKNFDRKSLNDVMSNNMVKLSDYIKRMTETGLAKSQTVEMRPTELNKSVQAGLISK